MAYQSYEVRTAGGELLEQRYESVSTGITLFLLSNSYQWPTTGIDKKIIVTAD